MDRNVILMVVGFLGGIGLLCVGGMVYLSHHGKEPPQALIAIASASIGSLSGILAAQKDSRP